MYYSLKENLLTLRGVHRYSDVLIDFIFINIYIREETYWVRLFKNVGSYIEIFLFLPPKFLQDQKETYSSVY